MATAVGLELSGGDGNRAAILRSEISDGSSVPGLMDNRFREWEGGPRLQQAIAVLSSAGDDSRPHHVS